MDKPGTVTSIGVVSPLVGGIITTSGRISIPMATSNTNGYLSNSDWSVFNDKQDSIQLTTLGTGDLATFVGNTLNIPHYQGLLTLTTIGSSGPATLIGNTLNVPQYSGGGGSGTVTSVSALTLGTTGTDLSSSVANSTTTPVITLNVPTASASNRGALSAADWSTFNGKQNALTNPVTGTGTNNELAYFNTTGSTISSLTTATYPSLTELSYVKGVTSAVQTQLNGKQGALTLTTFGTSGASTINFGTNTLNIPNYANTSADGVNITVAYNALGSSIKGYNIPTPNCNITATNPPTSGNLYFIAYHLPVAATITGVKWFQPTIGSYTANNYNGVALYSYSGGTMTLVASSTNDGTIWQTGSANIWKSKAFSSTYSASAGVYYLAFIYSSSAQTTAPVLGTSQAFGNSGSVPFDFTNSARVVGVIGSITSLPSSQVISGLNSHTANYALFLY